MSLVLFSGGRGNKNLLNAAINEESFTEKLDIIVNGLDDGASTGSIREIFDNRIHGISDFLKVATALSLNYDLVSILEKRLPFADSYRDHLHLTKLLSDLVNYSDSTILLDGHKYSSKDIESITKYLDIFLEFTFKKFKTLPNLGDYKLGNIVFAALLIESDLNFGVALTNFLDLLGVDKSKYSIHQSSLSNSYLVGLLKNGSLLPNEASIVLTRTSDFIASTYQVPLPLSAKEIRLISSHEINNKMDTLKRMEFIPEPSNGALKALRESKGIIYGAGTPYSSLLPSLELPGIADCIQSNNCPKILVSNLVKETSNTITVSDLVQNVISYLEKSLNNKISSNLSSYISHIIVPHDALNNLPENWIDPNIDQLCAEYEGIEIIKADIRLTTDPSKHDGIKLLNVIMDIVHDR